MPSDVAFRPKMDSSVLTDGKSTVVEITIHAGDKVYTEAGSSRRVRGDIYDADLGVQIATARALDKIVTLMKSDVRKLCTMPSSS